MRRFSEIAAVLVLGMTAGAAWAADAAPPFDPAEALPGGAATSETDDPAAAFARPVGNLPESARAEFALGLDLFYRRWIEGPAPPPALTGLGPLYNALSCQQCHLNDGRGRPPAVSGDAVSFALKLEPPHPAYGYQIQDRAVAGQRPEGAVGVVWRPVYHNLGEDGVAALRQPEWSLIDGAHGDVAGGRLSGRIAPPVAGAGLLEAIPAADIAAKADPADADGDGVSGRLPPGRFGWRGDAKTLEEQTARAFANDMGVATALLPNPNGDCPPCRSAAPQAEATGDRFRAIVMYARNLGQPSRPRAGDPAVLRGRTEFHAAGCAACHTPSHRTGPAPAAPWLADQTIWPYTDLLLHDMGPDLAAGGSAEWRTAPLWGLGRNGEVNGNRFYLHDGRARSPLEATLWHGGEAAGARDAVKALPPDRRRDLLAFLDSL